MSKRIWRIHHVASAGIVDYYVYFKYETSAKNALIGRGPIRQHGVIHTLQVFMGYGLWVDVSIKDISGTKHYETAPIVYTG